MPDNPYHEIPYVTGPIEGTHPDRLAAVARLFGLEPAPVTACRVLEIGCGTGGNLIPMAFRLPGSHFTGIDLADQAIAEGQRAAGELNLPNLDLIAMDLRDVGTAMGEFDYILVHGLFSWIPDDLRDRLLEVCRERLAPAGVVFLSYNTLPGRHVLMMFREMIQYHTRNCAGRERIERARELVRQVGEARLTSAAWQPMVEQEVQRILECDDGSVFHDDLAPINDAFYVRDFVERAERHSLQYLGDAQTRLMFDARTPIDRGGGIEREQYFDFLSLRKFRQTLLCAAEAPLERPASPKRMDGFRFSSEARQAEGQIVGLHGVRLNEKGAAARRVALAMGQVYPRPLSFEQFFEVADDPDALRAILFRMAASGFAHFHAPGPAGADRVSPRPKVHRLARWENARTGILSYGNHTANRVDGTVRALIELLDGTRDVEALASELARVPGAPRRPEIRARLPQVLTHMLYADLLEEG